MDVMNVEQAKIAEAAGAVAVMALERIPADIRRDGGVARMSDPCLIAAIKSTVTIPVMAKARIGHFVEAQILEACEVDYIDESEVLTMADDINHIDPTGFPIFRVRAECFIIRYQRGFLLNSRLEIISDLLLIVLSRGVVDYFDDF